MIRSNGFWTIFAAAVAVQIAAGQFTFFPGLVGQQHNKKKHFFLEHNQCITFLFWQWKGDGGGGAEILRKDKVSC